MKVIFQNVRDVKIVDKVDKGNVYSCTIDLYMFDEDPINGKDFLTPNSGAVNYVAHPDDEFGLGPSIYKAIENGEYTGEIEE